MVPCRKKRSRGFPKVARVFRLTWLDLVSHPCLWTCASVKQPVWTERAGQNQRSLFSSPGRRQRAWPRLLASISFLPSPRPSLARFPITSGALFAALRHSFGRDGYNNNGSSLQCYVWCNVRVRRKLCCSDCGSGGWAARGGEGKTNMLLHKEGQRHFQRTVISS